MFTTLSTRAQVFLYALLIAAFVLFCGPALAQDAEPVIDFTPLLNEVVALVGLILSGLATWGVTYLRAFLKAKTGLELRAQDIQLAYDGIDRGIAYADRKARSALAGNAKVKVGNQFVADAADYVFGAIPGVLTRLGITKEQLAAKIVSQLPEPPQAEVFEKPAAQ